MADPVLTAEEREHSALSASAASRWINCTPSLMFTEEMPDETSSYAEEGTRAHALCAWKVAEMFHVPGIKRPEYEYDAATEDCADGYCSYIAERMTEHAALFLEQRVDYSEFTAPGSFGTADCVIVEGNTLHIVDYKHGMGVPVEADHNPQLMLYALGAYSRLKDVYDIDTVEMAIYQPRIGNISSSSMPLSELLEYAETTFRPRAHEALTGAGEFKCGSWCKFCRGRHTCRARAEANLAEAREDFAMPPKLTDDEVAELLPKLDRIESWCEDLKAYALQAALNGTQYKGYKLVYGRSIRKFSDEDAAAAAIQAAGFYPYEKKLQSMTNLTKMLGKKQFEELLGSYIIKPQGKPTLVPENDKRPSLAQSDFTTVN